MKTRFEIKTAIPLEAGQQVFIAGDLPELGAWEPDALPLTRVDDALWTAEVDLPEGVRFQYKITRGFWESEELQADGRIPPNRQGVAGCEPLVCRVANWKDRAWTTAPRITGNYRVHEGVHSKFLRYDRRVIVWLPPGYDYERGRRYPVLYMQDGQQVLDPTTSTWNQDWQVDEHAQEMIQARQMQPVIVVAVYSTEDRFVEYNPAQAGPEYLRFLLEELKPFIDQQYRTDPAQNAIAGSSMGGLFAFYAAWQKPEVFSRAACLSPAFRFQNDESMIRMVVESDVPPRLRLFIYCGEGDSLERQLMVGTRMMHELLLKKDFPRDDLLFTTDLNACHNEAAWEKQTPAWLGFLWGT